MKKPLAPLVLTCILLLGSAQEGDAEDTPKEFLALQIVQEEDVARALIEMMNPFLDELVRAYASQLDAVEDKADLVYLRDRFRDEMQRSADELEIMLARIYARHLSREALHGILDFYNTPAGQELIEQTPRIEAQAEVVGERWFQGVSGRAISHLGE